MKLDHQSVWKLVNNLAAGCCDPRYDLFGSELVVVPTDRPIGRGGVELAGEDAAEWRNVNSVKGNVFRLGPVHGSFPFHDQKCVAGAVGKAAGNSRPGLVVGPRRFWTDDNLVIGQLGAVLG